MQELRETWVAHMAGPMLQSLHVGFCPLLRRSLEGSLQSRDLCQALHVHQDARAAIWQITSVSGKRVYYSFSLCKCTPTRTARQVPKMGLDMLLSPAKQNPAHSFNA